MLRHKRQGIVEAAKDAVFPSRVLKRQLDEAQRRLHSLEDEYGAIAREEEKQQRRRRSGLTAVAFAGEESPVRNPPPSSRPLPSVPQTPADFPHQCINRTKPGPSHPHITLQYQGATAISPRLSPRLLSPRSPRCISTTSSSPLEMFHTFRRSMGNRRKIRELPLSPVQAPPSSRPLPSVPQTPLSSCRHMPVHSGSSSSSSSSPLVLVHRARRRRRSRASPLGLQTRGPPSAGCGVVPLMESTPHCSRGGGRQFTEAASYLYPHHGCRTGRVSSPVPPSPPPPSLESAQPPSPPPNSAQTNNSFSPASVFLI